MINKRIAIEMALAEMADANQVLPQGSYTTIARQMDVTYNYVAVVAMRLGFTVDRSKRQ